MNFVYGGGDDDIDNKLREDPLFLIRKEIAVMKKLEYVPRPVSRGHENAKLTPPVTQT